MGATSGWQQKFFYSFGQFGNGVYNGFNAILNLYVRGFTSNAFIIGYLSNTRTIEGVVIQPIVGRLSDRSTRRLGRRKPFILFGIPISVFFLLLIPELGHARHNFALPLIAAAIILFSITWNIAGDPYQALMVDITEEKQRSIFNAILSVIALAGQVAILVYAIFASLKKNNIPDQVFFFCAIFLLLTYAVVFFGVREPKAARAVASVEGRIPIRAYIDELRSFKEAFKLLISIFFLWTGLNAVQPFLNVFTKDVMHVSNAYAIAVYLTIIVVGGMCAYPFGRLGARYGNRRFIIVGTVLLILAAIGGTLAPTYFWLYPVAVLAGAGFSATTVLTYPYLSQLVSGSKIGVFTGLQTAFSAIAVPLSAAATGGLITLFGYRSIFVMLGAMMVFDVAFLLSIHEPAAREQVSRVDEAERVAADRQVSMEPVV